jgi:hypothetical protein
LARAAKLAARKKDPLLVVRDGLAESLQELVEASRGKGHWKDLPAQSRLTALLKVIEYGVGKSVSLDKMGGKDTAAEGGDVEKAGTLEFD